MFNDKKLKTNAYLMENNFNVKNKTYIIINLIFKFVFLKTRLLFYKNLMNKIKLETLGNDNIIEFRDLSKLVFEPKLCMPSRIL